MSTTGKPFLRALKCAYKLHQAGLREANVVSFLEAARYVPGDQLPSAGAPVDVIVETVYEHTQGMPLSSDTIARWADDLGFEVQS